MPLAQACMLEGVHGQALCQAAEEVPGCCHVDIAQAAQQGRQVQLAQQHPVSHRHLDPCKNGIQSWIIRPQRICPSCQPQVP